MPKWFNPHHAISARDLTDEFQRLRRGSVTRRHFLSVTGLGLAAAVLARQPGLFASTAHAEDELTPFMSIATWPNYHDPASFEAFTEATGVAVEVNVFGSNEEMLEKLQSGTAGWDMFVPTNYAIPTYAALGLIDPLDLSRIPSFDPAMQNVRFTERGVVGGKVYGLPKNWGTTGFVVNTDEMGSPVKSWKDFFDVAMGEADGRAIVHDYQLTAVGNALVSLGFSFNSVEPKELAQAEELLVRVKPHLNAVNSDYQPAMRAGDAWMSMCWTNDAVQLNRDMPEIRFGLGSDGGEIWTDFYAIPSGAANKPAAYALIDFLLNPQIAMKEHIAHGAPATDSRVIAMLPAEISRNRIIYPDEAALTPLEFAAAVTLTDPGRAAVMARFLAA